MALSFSTPTEQITSLYVGYFNRAPDPAGLQYWVTQLNGGMTLAQIANSFSVQPETAALYPFFASPDPLNAATVIDQAYHNLFNRAPDAGGSSYWTGQLTAPGKTVGQVILDMISGA